MVQSEINKILHFSPETLIINIFLIKTKYWVGLNFCFDCLLNTLKIHIFYFSAPLKSRIFEKRKIFLFIHVKKFYFSGNWFFFNLTFGYSEKIFLLSVWIKLKRRIIICVWGGEQENDEFKTISRIWGKGVNFSIIGNIALNPWERIRGDKGKEKKNLVTIFVSFKVEYLYIRWKENERCQSIMKKTFNCSICGPLRTLYNDYLTIIFILRKSK